MNQIIDLCNTNAGIMSVYALAIFGIKKYIDYSLKGKMNIAIEKIKSDYNKKVHAYDFLLKKEIGYYEKVDCEYADLIVDIQDINYYIVKANTMDIKFRKQKSKELILKIIQQTERLKGYLLSSQCYIPEEVWSSAGGVVVSLQNSCKELSNICEAFILGQEINTDILDKMEKNILMQVATANCAIQNRLKNMV